MITWVLILHLFGSQPQAEMVTMPMQWGRQCKHACTEYMADGQYQGKDVVNCQCMRANEFYANMAGGEPDSYQERYQQ